MPAGDLADDGEPEAEAAGVAIAAVVQARERLEQALAFRAGNAPAVSFDVDTVRLVVTGNETATVMRACVRAFRAVHERAGH